jgi:hypothetical protein
MKPWGEFICHLTFKEQRDLKSKQVVGKKKRNPGRRERSREKTPETKGIGSHSASIWPKDSSLPLIK